MQTNSTSHIIAHLALDRTKSMTLTSQMQTSTFPKTETTATRSRSALEQKSVEHSLDLEDGSRCCVVVTRFSNRALVVVSNTGTFGSIVHARREQSLRGGKTYDVHTVLGDRNDPMPELCARLVVEGGEKQWNVNRGGMFPTVMFCFGLSSGSLSSKKNMSLIVKWVVNTLDELSQV